MGIVLEVIKGIDPETMMTLGAGLAGFVGYYVNKSIGSIKAHFKKKAERASVPELVKKDIGVYRDLTELLVQTEADRTFVIQFHNGTYYMNKAGQMKMSCTHEIVKDGVSREQDKMQDLLLSKYSSMVNSVIGSPYVEVCVKKDNYYFAQLLRSQGVETCLLCVIKDDDIIEGLIGANYLEGHDKPKGAEEAIMTFTKKIGFLLRSQDE